MSEKQVELDDLFSSSSDEEENNNNNNNNNSTTSTTLSSSSNQQQENNSEELEELDYMDDQFIKSLESVEHERLPSMHPSEASKKISFRNVPLELLQSYNTARDEKQFKKAHHLKKQIREYNIKEEMLEKAKMSLSKSLIVQEEEKEAGKQSMGLKLLKKMGFEQGSGLGKNNQGKVAPISIDKQLDYLMESMDASKKKPIIGLDEVQVARKEEIDKFKSEMEKKKKAPTTTEEEFTKIMMEKHKEQKRKREMRMALTEEAVEAAAKKKKQDDDWADFEDF